MPIANSPKGSEQSDNRANFQSAKNIQMIAISAIERFAIPSGIA